jgi:hypothetical protein
MDCNEDCLKNKIKEMLDDDFILRDSVKGINPVENKKVIIDYMLYPKIHLIENGFDPHWVGVEIKYIKDCSGKQLLIRNLFSILTVKIKE